MLVTTYRPLKYSAHLYVDCNKLLSVVRIDFDCVVMIGSFNIHIDNQQSQY